MEGEARVKKHSMITGPIGGRRLPEIDFARKLDATKKASLRIFVSDLSGDLLVVRLVID
jgi:hypothetical protein